LTAAKRPAPPGNGAPDDAAAPGRLAADAAGMAIGTILAGVGFLRHTKPVHPHGVTYRARLSVPGAPAAPAASTLLSTPGERDAVVRFSRSLGLPRPLPDLLGMSIRVVDAYGAGRHQDLLLVTCGRRPVLHHVFLPAGDVQQRPYSSALPYAAGDRRFLVGALPDASAPRPPGADLFARLARAAASGRLTFGLAVAAVPGPFVRVATIHVLEPLPDTLEGLRFSPFNSGGGLWPSGLLNRTRRTAYPLSQRAWAAAGHADAQRQADAALQTLGR
jgi:hypothetical protein